MIPEEGVRVSLSLLSFNLREEPFFPNLQKHSLHSVLGTTAGVSWIPYLSSSFA